MIVLKLEVYIVSHNTMYQSHDFTLYYQERMMVRRVDGTPFLPSCTPDTACLY